MKDFPVWLIAVGVWMYVFTLILTTSMGIW